MLHILLFFHKSVAVSSLVTGSCIFIFLLFRACLYAENTSPITPWVDTIFPLLIECFVLSYASYLLCQDTFHLIYQCFWMLPFISFVFNSISRLNKCSILHGLSLSFSQLGEILAQAPFALLTIIIVSIEF